MSIGEVEEINELKENLDRAYREMAEGVREFLDLQENFKRVRKEKQDLTEAAVKAITSSSNVSEENAKKMLDEWLKAISNVNKEKDDV